MGNEYKAILRLKQMLDDAGIPYESFDSSCWGGYQLRLNSNIDVIEHYYSLGEDRDLLEIMGALTEEELKLDTVQGYLTAEEVFKRFKYCYEHNTNIYRDDEYTITVDEIKQFCERELETLEKERQKKVFGKDWYSGAEAAYKAVLETIWWGTKNREEI